MVLRCQSLLGKPELRTSFSISPFKIVGSIALLISELISHIAHLKACIGELNNNVSIICFCQLCPKVWELLLYCMLSICGRFLFVSFLFFVSVMFVCFSTAEAVRSSAKHFASFNHQLILNDYQRLRWENQGLESLSYEENRVNTTLCRGKLV